jgi:hypothetical protein
VRRFPLLVIILVPFTLVPSFGQEQDTDGLPRSWDIKQIEKDAPNSVVPGRFYVLAWHASAWTFTGKEFRQESCLALRVHGKEKPERWDLYHLYRRPLEKDATWSISMHHATGGEAGPTGRWYFHSQVFNSRPGNKQIYDSLGLSSKGVNWTFERGDNCVGCGVCKKNWEEPIGEKPTKRNLSCVLRLDRLGVCAATSRRRTQDRFLFVRR